MRILLVEDNPADSRLVEEALQGIPGLPTQFTFAPRLRDATRLLEMGDAHDVVLLDLGLPDATGALALTEVLRVAPVLPIIVLTGRDDEDLALRAVREGAQDYLLKGEIAGPTLFRAIRYAIERKRNQSRERLLMEVGSLFASTPDHEDALRRLATLAAQSFGDCCLIDIVGDDGTVRRLHATHRQPSLQNLANELLRYPALPDESPLLKRLQSGNTFRNENLAESDFRSMAWDENHLRILRALGLRSYIAVPLIDRQQLIGYIHFISSSRCLDAEDQTLAEKIGRITSYEISNAYLYKRAQEALRARDIVLRVVAHDLRNPLNAISMSAALLMDPGFTGERHAKQIEVIQRSTARMGRLIQDLLDVARIEGDRLQLRLEPQNPVMLAREAVELNMGLVESHGISLEARAGEGDTPPVRADRDRILQVLSNLIGNAVKFTPAGGRVEVYVDSKETSTCFSVSDTGCGISLENQKYLFTPFWQGLSDIVGRGRPGAGHCQGNRRSARRPYPGGKRRGQGHRGLLHTSTFRGAPCPISFFFPADRRNGLTRTRDRVR